jgi:hypothetical protein
MELPTSLKLLRTGCCPQLIRFTDQLQIHAAAANTDQAIRSALQSGSFCAERSPPGVVAFVNSEISFFLTSSPITDFHTFVQLAGGNGLVIGTGLLIPSLRGFKRSPAASSHRSVLLITHRRVFFSRCAGGF